MSTRNCQNCDVPYGPDDMFCENCGYDFITGSLPVEGGGPVPPAPSNPKPGSSAAAPGGDPAGQGAVGDAGRDVTGELAAGAAGGPGVGGPPSILDGPGELSGAGPAAADPDADPDGAAPGRAVAGAAIEGGGPGAGPVPEVHRLRMSVAVDRGFFDEVVNDGEIDFPDPAPADQELDLPGTELHIGRTSESRAIHPDIDVAALTEDQAVSSRHAILRVANDGSLTIVDVGSTNGTFLDAVDSEAITHGVPMEVKPGVPIFVGAWTRLTVLD